MRRLLRVRSVVLAVALTILGALGAIGNAQQLSGAVADQHQAAIRALGLALSAAPDKLDPLLGRIGFASNLRPPDFEAWPTVRKLETAYLSAVGAGGPEEGERFLRTLSRTVASDISNAIRFERSLRAYFPESPSGPLPLEGVAPARFVPITADINADVAQPIRAAILSIERYVERVPGGLQSVLAACCGLASADSYDILRRSASRPDALAAAIQKGRIPPGLQERLLRAVRVVAENSNAVRYDASLRPLLDQLERGNNGIPRTAMRSDAAPSTTTLARDSSGSKAIIDHVRQAATEAGTSAETVDALSSLLSGGGGGGDANLQRYREAQSELAREVSRRSRPSSRANRPVGTPRPSFRVMRSVARGFGGVVFGASVTAGAQTPRPIELRWVEDGDVSGALWGHFDVVFANGDVRMTRRMRQADAFAAIEIVAGRSDVFDALDVVNEEGVGLAGVARARSLYEHQFLVHPALFGLSIGDAAILADATGFVMSAEALEEALQAAGIAPTVRKALIKWQTAENGFYKIIDVPTRIMVRDGIVRAERLPDGVHPTALRRTAFLTFQAYDESNAPLPEGARPFYANLPSLAAALPQFDQLNAFSETFAIVRWASLSKARVTPPVAPTRGNARTLVKTADDGSLLLLSDAEWTAEQARELEAVITIAEQTATARIEAAGVPDVVKAKSDALFRNIREAHQLNLALKALERVTGGDTPTLDVESTERRLREKRNEAIQRVPARTLRGLALYIASPDTAAALNRAYAQLEASDSALEDAVDSLAAAEDPPLDERIQKAPPDQRATLLRLQKAVQAAEEALDRASLENFDAAFRALEAAREKLTKALPPLDYKAIQAARTREQEAENARAQATKEVARVIDSHMPWFEDWFTVVERLAFLF